jgi:hypothetical protein
VSRAVVLASLLLAAMPAAAKDSRAHMEACVRWEIVGGTVGTLNRCDTPVHILFMALDDPRVIEGEVRPGEWFDANIPAAPHYMFTVCPVGYAPSVRFAPENAGPIIESLYNCLPNRPNS